jgi:hypothetical protein
MMKISVNITSLNHEQVKCLTQLGMFTDDQTWESYCEPADIQEVLDLLVQAGITKLFLQLGSAGTR